MSILRHSPRGTCPFLVAAAGHRALCPVQGAASVHALFPGPPEPRPGDMSSPPNRRGGGHVQSSEAQRPGDMSSPPKRNGQGTCPVLGRADGQGGIMASGGDQDWACPVGAARHRVGHVQFWAGRVGKMGVCPVAAARTGHVQLGRGARTGHVQWGRPSAERDPGLDRNRGISGGVALVEQGPG